MAKFEHYQYQGGVRLRCGYTTGSCAALAAKAAARRLLLGKSDRTATIVTPVGIQVEVDVCTISCNGDAVSCGVYKDAGDDIDVTDGALICATVAFSQEPGIRIDGGEGVGRVTRKGLEQPVGAAAINRVPRQMIEAEVLAVCEQAGYTGGLAVTISAPQGKELAKKTFNPNLGIEGGISILGTSGIVEPKSMQALRESMRVEIRQLAANGEKKLLLTPGNYGADFIAAHPVLLGMPVVQCANFIGDALDDAAQFQFAQVLLVGHMGKFVKLAGGIMNTHSRWADCRMELIAAHAALHGASRETVEALMQAVTTDACLEILEEQGLEQAVVKSLAQRAQWHISRRAGGAYEIGLVFYNQREGELFVTEEAQRIILGRKKDGGNG
ncbi:MAG: cobalt-precorrin-5B (C(1))-methyltransferase CbiD [Oscillospiraceae bacterium]|nr:cobalt-precorrin-5B (C(1))-methyltransferase CbiD [Oscillospiraceae bacterium]